LLLLPPPPPPPPPELALPHRSNCRNALLPCHPTNPTAFALQVPFNSQFGEDVWLSKNLFFNKVGA